MSRIFITGSTDGIGLAAAKALVEQGHKVTLHARSQQRADEALKTVPSAEGVLIGDLSSLADTKRLAAAANQAGPWDCVVHNAGVGTASGGNRTVDGYSAMFQVNSLAPYVLTALMERPKRVMYVSSSMHTSGDDSLEDIAGTGTGTGAGKGGRGGWSAYSDSKLQNVLLANYVARQWSDVQACSFDPGWVRTKLAMGSAPGVVATPGKAIALYASGNSDLVGQKSGAYFSTSGVRSAHKGTLSESKQDRYVQLCEELSKVAFPT